VEPEWEVFTCLSGAGSDTKPSGISARATQLVLDWTREISL
jgi:hypothetical protein